MCLSGARPQRHDVALLRRVPHLDPGDELRRRAGQIGGAEDERVGADVFDNVDARLNPFGCELE
jgi:hypothetical protein